MLKTVVMRGCMGTVLYFRPRRRIQTPGVSSLRGACLISGAGVSFPDSSSFQLEQLRHHLLGFGPFGLQLFPFLVHLRQLFLLVAPEQPDAVDPLHQDENKGVKIQTI